MTQEELSRFERLQRAQEEMREAAEDRLRSERELQFDASRVSHAIAENHHERIVTERSQKLSDGIAQLRDDTPLHENRSGYVRHVVGGSLEYYLEGVRDVLLEGGTLRDRDENFRPAEDVLGMTTEEQLEYINGALEAYRGGRIEALETSYSDILSDAGWEQFRADMLTQLTPELEAGIDAIKQREAGDIRVTLEEMTDKERAALEGIIHKQLELSGSFPDREWMPDSVAEICEEHGIPSHDDYLEGSTDFVDGAMCEDQWGRLIEEAQRAGSADFEEWRENPGAIVDVPEGENPEPGLSVGPDGSIRIPSVPR